MATQGRNRGNALCFSGSSQSRSLRAGKSFFDGHAARRVTAKPSAAHFEKRAEPGARAHEYSRFGLGFSAQPGS
jgi:hypothetical protein